MSIDMHMPVLLLTSSSCISVRWLSLTLTLLSFLDIG